MARSCHNVQRSAYLCDTEQLLLDCPRRSQKHSCQSPAQQQAVEVRINADSIHFQDKMTPQRDALRGNSILFQCLRDCILVSSIFSLTMIKGILTFPLPGYGPACCCSQL